MKRPEVPVEAVAHGRASVANEPLVFHCNHYNYWLQKTVLLDASLGMREVIHDAAAEAARALVGDAEGGPQERLVFAEAVFGYLGFGVIHLQGVGPEGGRVHVPVSHYGQCLQQAVDAEFARPQSLFDAGFAAGAVEAAHGHAPGTLHGRIEACMSMGGAQGIINVEKRTEGPRAFTAPGMGPHGSVLPQPIYQGTNVDEPAILAALAGLDLSGNEEGLIPRFGVMLTRHFANFYNRISFEFLHKMTGTGLAEAAEVLLRDAGYRCAFNTFGGIMLSDEWKAVVRPSCTTSEDWVAGMVAVTNALGWGVWRIQELSKDKVVIRIYDDYESTGYLAMYGRAERPVSHLAQAGVEGLMNLVFVGDIASGPTLDADYFTRVFESENRYSGRQNKCIAVGDDYTEITATR